MRELTSRPRETVTYIEAMLSELGTLSRKAQTPMLTYLIEMATAEASDVASGRSEPADPSNER